ncbi:MAG TPA: DCC1-like thiol-disulfide oxidoreductase family protein [Chitinophagaceae bacterium]
MNDHPIILFDGVCNFCNAIINFIIRQDNKKVFRFATLQSKTGKEILLQNHFPENYCKTFLLIDGEKVYKSSTAGIKLYGMLPWYWKWTQILWIVPRFIRDGIYEYISDNRYRWFGKREHCMIPAADTKERFLE